VVVEQARAIVKQSEKITALQQQGVRLPEPCLTGRLG
jgi:hypothetical protein